MLGACPPGGSPPPPTSSTTGPDTSASAGYDKLAGSLRIVSFNTDLDSCIVRLGKESFLPNRCEELDIHVIVPAAQRIASALLATRADVIALQNVFSETARYILRKRLREAGYRLIADIDATATLPHQDVVQQESSGLMLFSMWPLSELSGLSDACRPGSVEPNEGVDRVAFVPFDFVCAHEDCLAAKGAAAVKIQTGDQVVDLVFTHLQAADEAADRNARRIQVEKVYDAYECVRSQGGGYEADAIVVGDFNVDGRLRHPVNGERTEWEYYFAKKATQLGAHFEDWWATYGSPEDVGLTHHVGDARYDYVLTRSDPVNRGCVQQATIMLEGLSGHSALEINLNRDSRFCNPKAAMRFDPQTRSLWNDVPVALTLDWRGSYVWVRVEQSGTYSFAVNDADVELTVYAASDTSHPLRPWNPPEPRAMDGLVGTFVADEALYLRLRSRTNVAKSFTLTAHRHACSGRDDACKLLPGAPAVAAEFPSAQPLGTRDTGYFVLSPYLPTMGGRQHIIVQLAPSGGAGPVSGTLTDASGVLLGDVVGNTLELDVQGGQDLVLEIRRTGNSAVTVDATWNTDLELLFGARNEATGEIIASGNGLHPLQLKCENEAGPDVFGDDEITVHFIVDHERIDLRPPDFDTNQREPLTALLQAQIGRPYLAFRHFAFSLTESDDGSANENTLEHILPMRGLRGSGRAERGEDTLYFFDAEGDAGPENNSGEYVFVFNRGKYLP